ncbi:MAG: aminopeptidase PepB [Candidatus Anaerobiospirillum merdipullorum]|uniref:Aminopeptidase PepB n=1 Tax=Candidatus Anaerobiospirillum merdipullorum TaxID=2838450 RepID=A0A9E2NRB0_9GAMM|nr:aminopeptidase PepB [Candidatus Anaerobiospirillum merdipullorum]
MKIYLSNPHLDLKGAESDAVVQLGASCSQELIAVSLASKAPDLYATGTQIFATANGVGVVYNPQDPQATQAIGRTLAQAGIFKVDLTNVAELNSVAALTAFIMGIYDGVHDVIVATSLAAADLVKVQAYATILCSARALAGSSAKESTPLKLIEKLQQLCQLAVTLRGAGQVKTTVIKRGDEDFARLAGLSAVGAGSINPPAMGIIEYIPQGQDVADVTAPLKVALVGKGICFDSGGYDLKSSKFMSTMRTDKSGAVYVAAALALAIVQGLTQRVACFLPCSENLVSGSSMLPGDIITYVEGTTIEINNTDAEGRLILADGILEAKRRQVGTLIDAATLTGAAKIAVGRDYTAYLSCDDALAGLVETCFKAQGEPVWRLPLDPMFARFMKSRRADMTNSGHGDGAPGASTAAIFLQHFVGEQLPWVHFDLSSAFMPDGSPYYAPEQSTAAGVRALATLILKLSA